MALGDRVAGESYQATLGAVAYLYPKRPLAGPHQKPSELAIKSTGGDGSGPLQTHGCRRGRRARGIDQRRRFLTSRVTSTIAPMTPISTPASLQCPCLGSPRALRPSYGGRTHAGRCVTSRATRHRAPRWPLCARWLALHSTPGGSDTRVDRRRATCHHAAQQDESGSADHEEQPIVEWDVGRQIADMM